VPNHVVTELAELEALYGEVNANSLAKETPALTPAYRAWIEAAPFLVLATSGPGGLDCSPRGDARGQLFAVPDDKTLLLPDRRGNNRLDSLRNIVADPRVALLFLNPGIDETLRVNGRAVISTDPALAKRFTVDGKPPRAVLVISIEAVYFQCARALIRSRLWDPDGRWDKTGVPTAGEMTRAAAPSFDAAAYDAALPGRQRSTLY
jgi:PPOX class probable FMN-dependent enzyme